MYGTLKDQLADDLAALKTEGLFKGEAEISTPQSARIMVDRAESTLGEQDRCWFCTVMVAVPSAIACARVGDLEGAHRFLALAEDSVSHWGLSSWQAAVTEAKATVALAEGDAEGYRRLSRQAADAYSSVGHTIDAERCLAAAAD